jgi:hypothetical protein
MLRTPQQKTIRRPPSTAPKNISLTNPEASWTAAPGGPAFYAYSTNYLIDLDAGIIVDVKATHAWRTDEVQSTKTTIERVEHRSRSSCTYLSGRGKPGSCCLLGRRAILFDHPGHPANARLGKSFRKLGPEDLNG